jgi:hypothetical protein
MITLNSIKIPWVLQKNCTRYLQILYLWLYRYGVHGFGYSVRKADPQYTHDKPYKLGFTGPSGVIIL